MCAVVASLDMANARSLNAVLYEAALYACLFTMRPDEPTVAERIRQKFRQKIGSSEPDNGQVMHAHEIHHVMAPYQYKRCTCLQSAADRRPRCYNERSRWLLAFKFLDNLSSLHGNGRNGDEEEMDDRKTT
jgi:hypothetical protein